MAGAPGTSLPPVPKGFAVVPHHPQPPKYADLTGVGISAVVLLTILFVARFGKGFPGQHLGAAGIVGGGVITAAMGLMDFHKVANAQWFNLVLPFEICRPVFDPVLILTMTLVMVVVMIESTGMFLALSDMTGKPISQDELTRGLRTDGLGTLIGGIFNTFPYTSFFAERRPGRGHGRQDRRWVCVAGGAILILLGLLPKMAMLIESLPTVVLGGAGLVMFGMVGCHRHPHPVNGGLHHATATTP